jgi:hypothetical protein
MAIKYRWREQQGEPYDPSEDGNEDDCGYCGAPPAYQHGDWSEGCLAELGQCPQCGATGLATCSINQQLNKKEDTMTRRERVLNHAGDALVRVNRVSQVLINVLGVRDGDVEPEALTESVKALDDNAARVVLNLAKALLALPGEPSVDEEADDATN